MLYKLQIVVKPCDVLDLLDYELKSAGALAGDAGLLVYSDSVFQLLSMLDSFVADIDDGVFDDARSSFEVI